jgi:hypothetical protein
MSQPIYTYEPCSSIKDWKGCGSGSQSAQGSGLPDGLFKTTDSDEHFEIASLGLSETTPPTPSSSPTTDQESDPEFDWSFLPNFTKEGYARECLSSSHGPSHYRRGQIQTWDFIRDQGLNFHLGNAIKYICRAGYKDSKVDDLKKAIHYLQNELEHAQS